MSSARLRGAEIGTAAIVVLTAVASAAGLVVSGLYGESALAPAMKGQDLVTLVTLPILAWTLVGVRRRAPRAMLVWIGLLGYLLYTYTGAAFAYRFNELFLLYLALFSLSLVALVAAVGGIDVSAIHARFDPSAPRKPVAVFLILIAVMLVVSELGQIVPALVNDTVPPLIVRSEGAGNFVYVLDLGVIAPLAVLAAVWLWRRSPWGDVLAGIILIKAATMGLALLSMTWFSVRADQALELGLTVAYGAIAAGGLSMSFWFLRHCRGAQAGGRPETKLATHAAR